MCLQWQVVFSVGPICWAKSPSSCGVTSVVESSWNVMAHGDAREEKWRGNKRMEWEPVSATWLQNTGLNKQYKPCRLMCTAVDRTDAPADLNGLLRFAERRNLGSGLVPSYFKRSLTHYLPCHNAKAYSTKDKDEQRNGPNSIEIGHFRYSDLRTSRRWRWILTSSGIWLQLI
jgi:hypothetical protein